MVRAVVFLSARMVVTTKQRTMNEEQRTKSRRLPHPKNLGDTLVEVMLSIVLISAAISLAIAMAHNNLSIGIDSGKRSSGTAIAQGQIERIRNAYNTGSANLDTYKNVGEDFCLLNDGSLKLLSEPNSPCKNFNNSSFTVKDTYSDSNKTFTVNVTWTSASGKQENQLSLYYKLPTAVAAPTSCGPGQAFNIVTGACENTALTLSLSATVQSSTLLKNIDGSRQYPGIIVQVNHSTVLNRVFNDIDSGPSCGGSYQTIQPSHTAQFDISEICQDYSINIPLDSISGPINNVEVALTNDHDGYNPAHIGDPNYWIDNNIILHSLILSNGQPVAFVNYPGSVVSPETHPPSGSLFPPNSLWINWGDFPTTKAIFKVE